VRSYKYDGYLVLHFPQDSSSTCLSTTGIPYAKATQAIPFGVAPAVGFMLHGKFGELISQNVSVFNIKRSSFRIEQDSP